MGPEADTSEEWALDISDDLEVPGWLYLPSGPSSAESSEWMAQAVEMLSPIIGAERWDGKPASEADVRELLAAGLDARALSDAVAMFQVWPVLMPVSVTCVVNILDSSALPDWGETDAVIHRAESPHVGPGLQCSTTRTVSAEADEFELMSVHFVFDNGEVALMLSLEESFPVLVTRALPGFVLLKDVIRMARCSDGKPFASVEPLGILDDSPWTWEGTT